MTNHDLLCPTGDEKNPPPPDTCGWCWFAERVREDERKIINRRVASLLHDYGFRNGSVGSDIRMGIHRALSAINGSRERVLR